MSISFRDKILHIDKVLGGVPGLFSRNSAGLVPQAPSGSGTTKFLREDREWVDAAQAKVIAPVESTSTASRAYAVGEQFVYNGLLTEATAAISQGATITVGDSGNAKLADCVMDQVIQLKDALTVQLRAIGTKNTSFASQLAELETVFNTLNTEEKTRAYIKDSNVIFRLDALAGVFLRSSCNNSSMTISRLNLSGHTREQWSSTGNTWTYANQSSIVSDISLELYA